MNGEDNAAALEMARPPRFRTLGITTCWSADEARGVLALLEMLRAEIEAVYAQEIGEAYHEAERAAAVARQQSLELEEPPF